MSFGEEVETLYDLISEGNRQLLDCTNQNELMKQAFIEYGQQFEAHLTASEDKVMVLTSDNQELASTIRKLVQEMGEEKQHHKEQKFTT